MQWLHGNENISPLRRKPGKVPLPVLVRNSVYDAMFYDTQVLTPEDWSLLMSDESVREEGGMLLVYPSKDGRNIEPFSRSFKLVERLQNNGQEIAIALPGVGSSVIGTASLARQVADVTGQPVVGIIAGYGAADMVSEALGGWFVFGLRNRVQSSIAAWRRTLGLEFTEEQKQALRDEYKIKSTRFLVDEPESNTLLNILLRSADNVKLLVGHSKGAMSIQNSLSAFLEKTNFKFEDYQDMAIVTFGCGVSLSDRFKNLHQFVGTWDVLGRTNTPITELTDPSFHWVRCKGHNLCISSNPIHMPFSEMLRDVIAVKVPSLVP